MTTAREKLIARIDKYQLRTGLSDYRLSLHASANQHAITRIRVGNAAAILIEQVEDYLDRFPDGPRRPTDGDGRRSWTGKPTKQEREARSQ